jgi:cation transport regulator ChaB
MVIMNQIAKKQKILYKNAEASPQSQYKERQQSQDHHLSRSQ